ncbi:MAG: type II toxin-antitoxin system HicB family antitoxin [Dehalococcoidia bacterium]|nr:type II toxin-antitoxin system HicB family antitoxin [Dehalococcoidia bacterium]
MKHVYPAVFHTTEEGWYSIWFPDICCGATMGNTLAEGLENAEDLLSGALYGMEMEGQKKPRVSVVSDIKTDDGDFVTLVSADPDDCRRLNETKLVKKTLVLPSWLNEKAIAANVNFSKILQTALKNELQLTAAE